jgi:peptidyl-tRNA hydrolase, PTH1 family
MGLFQKLTQDSSSAPLYTLGQEKTVLIIGLGNIGKQFDGTRHNIGFACVDAFAVTHEYDGWAEKKDLKCFVASKTLGGTRVILCKPTTMMNLSGEAIQKVASFYKIPASHVIVVHDELDIPFGQIRTRVGGSDAGNNGVKSAIQHLGEDFGRVRIGIKAETLMDASDFVLAKFSPEEQPHLKPLTHEVISLLTEAIYRGELTPETRSFIV